MVFVYEKSASFFLFPFKRFYDTWGQTANQPAGMLPEPGYTTSSIKWDLIPIIIKAG